ncbi:MAG: aldo/keto reductase [Thermoanaerobaculia bacterium]|nr:aldo/keto reductase [Thermoanaerobaculia bacterium]
MISAPSPAEVERLELCPGYHIARLINGGWQLSAEHDSAGAVASDVLAQLERLVDAGFTTFDCADIYTGVEELLGRLVVRLRRRGIDREAVQIHTKFVPDLEALAQLTATDVERTLDRSLQRLGVEALDLVQFHWWDYTVPGYVETAWTLDQLRRKGKIRHLGVTNFDRRHLEEVVDAGVKIASHQCQYSLLDQRPAADLQPFCRDHGIRILAYGTLAGGFLADRWLDRPTPQDVANRSLVKYRLIVDEAGGWEYLQDLLIALCRIAARHRTTASAIAIRWTLDRPEVAAAIVGARSDGHLEVNRAVFGLQLSDEDRHQLDSIVGRSEGPSGPVFGLERMPGGRHSRIMKTGLGGTLER